MPQNAFEALQSILKEVATNSLQIPDKTIWNNIIEKLEAQGRSQKAMFNTIRDLFISQCNMNVSLFAFFGDWLFRYADLSTKQETTRTIFTLDLLSDNVSLKTIIDNKEKMPSIINAAKEEAEPFKDKIQDMFKDGVSEDFVSLASLLGIKKKREKKEERKDK
jgi:hypothetical protein